jgi:tetratricopeptide (TPR) repeat protein
MGAKFRWLRWALPLFFLGLVFLIIWRQDPDFWRRAASLHVEAQEAARRGDRTQALDLAQRAARRDPARLEAAAFLGRLYLDYGRPTEALEVFRRMGARAPQNPEAVKGQAQALNLLGRRSEALAALKDYLQANPQSEEGLKFAADFCAQHNEDRELPVSYLSRLYPLNRDPMVRRQLVDLLLSLQRFSEAIPLQEEEAAQFPENQEGLHRLALIHYWNRDYQAAAPVYQRLVELAGENSEMRLEAAKNAEAAQDLDQALSQYLWLYGRHRGKKEYALALARLWSQKGNHAEAAAVLGSLASQERPPELQRFYALELLMTGRHEQALKAYQAAWEAGDTHKETILNLARLKAEARRFTEAAGYWDEADRRQLVQGDLRWEAALTYSYAQRYPEAVRMLKPLNRQDPKNPKVLLFLGQLHFYQKDWPQAARYFQAYLKEHPQDAEVRVQCAEALSFSPETREEALGQYAETLKQGDSVILRLRRVSLLAQEGKWAQAERELKECPLPGESRLLHEQARLFLWLGDLEESLDRYERFLAQAPGDRAGRLEKARVLTYLGRPAEALKLLEPLRQGQPRDREVLVAAVEALLAQPDNPLALKRAEELAALANLSLEERAWVARTLARFPRQHLRAVDLVLTNLAANRHHQASLLILAYLLPQLPRYEDLEMVERRLRGVRRGSPEHAASLAYFDSSLGRRGGKIHYLLLILRGYRYARTPKSPGELLYLAGLAQELGEREAALDYYRRAQKARPGDPRIARLKQQCLMAQKDWAGALKDLQTPGGDPAKAMEMARLYLMRGQYEGVKAVSAQVPEGAPEFGQARLLMAQACRLEQNYPEALTILASLEGKVPREAWLMEKARVLEAKGDKGAIPLYEEITRIKPDSQEARVAQARRDRARGDWSKAYQHFAQALKQAPQDVELFNELEGIRQEMRPQVAARGGFPTTPGARRPEEAQRPWQFSRFDREPQGLGLSNYVPAFLWDVLPVVQPEALYFTDSNKIHGGLMRMSGGFWVTKVLPVNVSSEYREYIQNTSKLRRASLDLGFGPLSPGDGFRVSGEIMLRRYWKRDDLPFTRLVPFPVPHFIPDTQRAAEDRSRILGTLAATFPVGAKTEFTLKYSRRDLFDQDAALYPRLYQGVQDLRQVRFTTLDQGEVGAVHQFRPGLEYRGNVGMAFYTDHNQRFTLYQGLAWQALNQPRMHLTFTPHLYLATYSIQREAYFSPATYRALGLGLDFDRKLFRLPTLILQGTVQGVGNHGEYGPALQGLAALEWEWVQNFYTNIHVFYFREWVDNYHLLAAGASFRWRF